MAEFWKIFAALTANYLEIVITNFVAYLLGPTAETSRKKGAAGGWKMGVKNGQVQGKPR